MHVVLVCENFSMKMGGEAQKSYFFLSRLLELGVEVNVITHARVEQEVRVLYREQPEIAARFTFIPDNSMQRVLWALGERLPDRLRDLFCGQLINVITMYQARKWIPALAAKGAQVVWQPIPISPRALCLLTGAGLPVVCGPMCGGLNFPPGFKFMDSVWTRTTIHVGRVIAALAHFLFSGKRRAAALIVSNERTARALPGPVRGKVFVGIAESGVDLRKWQPTVRSDKSGPVRFLFVGRLVDWKGVQYLVEAFNRIASDVSAQLHIVGDGPMLPQIEDVRMRGARPDQVVLHGWQSAASIRTLMEETDVFVMPSLRECGGNAILEAMACGKPLIVCNWAGPAQYASEQCAILVDPSSPPSFVVGLSEAMARLASNGALREAMGRESLKRVQTSYFDWDAKVARIVEIMRQVAKVE